MSFLRMFSTIAIFESVVKHILLIELPTIKIACFKGIPAIGVKRRTNHRGAHLMIIY